tara:strand:+ start:243 stop:1253 length:1011 start_codon:yes stop_codon:yes gene_type:complete
MKIKILVCGGGTIGHVTPALALVENTKHDLLWLGTDRIDSRILSQKKIKHINQNLISGRNLKSMTLHLKAVLKTLKVIKNFQPDLVIGTGGYASFPGIISSKIMNKKIILIEPNAKPGWANKILSKFAKKIICQKNLKEYFGEKSIPLGIPVYQKYKDITKTKSRKKLKLSNDLFVITITGGSQGSQKLNKLILDSLTAIKKEFSNLFILWQSGEKVEPVTQSLKEKKISHLAKNYTEELETWMSASDIVFCRAGACTLAEIKALGKKSIIIPLKGADDHQMENAKEHAKKYPSKILKEKSSPFSVLESIRTLNSEKNPKREGLENSKRISKLIFD